MCPCISSESPAFASHAQRATAGTSAPLKAAAISIAPKYLSLLDRFKTVLAESEFEFTMIMFRE